MDWRTVCFGGIKDVTKGQFTMHLETHYGKNSFELLTYEQENDEAVVRFEKSTDAEHAINTTTYEMDGAVVNASWWCNKVVVDQTGDITSSRLKVYFSNKKRGGAISNMEITNTNKAVITFKHQQDVMKVVETDTYNISGTTVEVKWKLQEKVFVEVTGWPAEESLSRLKMFFSNKSRGGPVETTTRMSEFIILQFKKEADAEKVVCQGKFQLKDTHLATKWYELDINKAVPGVKMEPPRLHPGNESVKDEEVSRGDHRPHTSPKRSSTEVSRRDHRPYRSPERSSNEATETSPISPVTDFPENYEIQPETYTIPPQSVCISNLPCDVNEKYIKDLLIYMDLQGDYTLVKCFIQAKEKKAFVTFNNQSVCDKLISIGHFGGLIEGDGRMHFKPAPETAVVYNKQISHPPVPSPIPPAPSTMNSVPSEPRAFQPSSKPQRDTSARLKSDSVGKSHGNGNTLADALSDIAAGNFKLRPAAERKLADKKDLNCKPLPNPKIPNKAGQSNMKLRKPNEETKAHTESQRDQSDVSDNMRKALHEQVEKFRVKVASSSEEDEAPSDEWNE